jgi:hypothetical protein
VTPRKARSCITTTNNFRVDLKCSLTCKALYVALCNAIPPVEVDKWGCFDVALFVRGFGGVWEGENATRCLKAHHIVGKCVVLCNGSKVLVTGLRTVVRFGGEPLTKLFNLPMSHQVIQSCNRCYGHSRANLPRIAFNKFVGICIHRICRKVSVLNWSKHKDSTNAYRHVARPKK